MRGNTHTDDLHLIPCDLLGEQHTYRTLYGVALVKTGAQHFNSTNLDVRHYKFELTTHILALPTEWQL